MGGGEDAAVGALGEGEVELRILPAHHRETGRLAANEVVALRRIGAAILDADDGRNLGGIGADRTIASRSSGEQLRPPRTAVTG